ncbi:dynein heavy chain, partial [Coemansia spiralis]
SLMETTKIYRQTSHRLHQHPEVLSLAAGYRRDVMVCIHKGMALKWQYFVTSAGLYAGSGAAAVGAGAGGLDTHDNRNASFVREFAAVVALFQEKVDALIALSADIDGAVRELSTCAYAEDNFRAILDQIQALIDRLNLDNYANLEQWVATLEARLEQVLAARLAQALQAWIGEFNRIRAQDDESDAETPETRLRAAESEAAATPRMRPLVHELRIRNQVMFLDPPLENARASWVQQLHSWLAAVCCQRRPQAARYEVAAGGGSGGSGGGADGSDDAEYDSLVLEYDPGSKAGAPLGPGHGHATTYRDLLSRLPGGGVREAYESIERMAGQAAAYVQVWLQYQALWDL